MQKIKSAIAALYTWLCNVNEDPRQKFWFLVIATLLSIFSIRFLPFSYRFTIPFGLDFGNGYWFQNCAAHRNNPYFVSGKECGDVLDRAMIYPPTMYWSYLWTRGVSFAFACGIWTLIIAGGIYWSIRKLPDYSRQAWPWLLYICLLLQFPSMFSFERGNNDVLVLIAWTFLMVTWLSEAYFIAGLVASFAVMLKLYPATALFIWGLGFLLSLYQTSQWKQIFHRPEFKFGLGFLTGAILLFLALYDQNVIYFSEILPKWMSNRQGRDVTIHSLYSVSGDLPMAILSLVLVLSWTKISARKMKEDPALVWTGLLALSTYFSGVSNDYNLITTYPLIGLCWFRSFAGPQKNLYFSFFASSFLGAIGWRWAWKNPIFHLVGMHIVFQVFWLAGFLLLSHFNDLSFQRKLQSQTN